MPKPPTEMSHEFSPENYRNNFLLQLATWVRGTPIHNPLCLAKDLHIDGAPIPDVDAGECCSDFSCCIPELMEQSMDRRYREAAEQCELVDKTPQDLNAVLRGLAS